jgi:septal ring factor EnvC (AmiA/AmiB activator)
MAARAPLLLLLLLTAAAPPRRLPEAQEAGLQMQEETASRLRQAQEEERQLAASRVEAAGRLRQAETATAEAADRMADLEARRQAAEQKLSKHAEALGPLLPLAERLALYPAETLLAMPGPPQDSARTLAVLRGLTRTLEREAAGLRAEQAEIDAAQLAVEDELPRLRAAQASQAAQAAQLDRQIESARMVRIRAEDAAVEAARRAAAEAARAENLAAAIAAMQAARARSEQQLREAAARAEAQRRDAAAAQARRQQEQIAAPAGPGMEPGSAHVLPVAGSVIRRWGDPTEAGPSTGISFRPVPMGRVVSPCTGRVGFAGPFRSYGVLVIIDCGGGYHFVLAGLDRLDVQAGNAVQAGEPVGVMPAWDPAQPGQRPSLYVQLRREGQPIDPAPFLRGRF